MQPVPSAQPRTRGGLLLWLGGGAIVVGIVVGIALLVSGVTDMEKSIERMERVSVREGGSVLVDEIGTHRVYFERSTSTVRFSTFEPVVTLRDPSGAAVPMRGSSGTTYTYDGRDGEIIGRFTAYRTGRYRVEVTDGGRFDALDTIAVSRRGPEPNFAKIGLAFLLGGGLVVAGIVMMIVGGVQRGRSRRAYQTMAVGGWGAPVGWGTPQPGWGAPQPGWGAPQPGWGPPAPQWGAPAQPGPPGWVPPPSMAQQPPQPAGWAPPAPGATYPPAPGDQGPVGAPEQESGGGPAETASTWTDDPTRVDGPDTGGSAS